MSAEHNKGDIDVVIPIEKFEGSYRKMAQGINDMVVGHITVKKKAMACVEQIGRGNFDAELEIFPGKKAFLNQIVETLRANLRGMIQEMDHMSAEHNKGDIDVVIPIEKFEGSYRRMAQGINDMVVGHITVKKKAMACVEQIGRGNFDAELEIFPGKKAFLNQIVETLRANLRGMIQEMDHMSAEHNKGDIDVFIPIEKFEGSYRKMAQGINDMVLGHITVKKKAMACVEQISRGNFEAELEKFPGKKAFLNQIVETLRSNLRGMILEMDHMSAEHTKGDIEVFIPADKFEGSYRKMAQGINDMVIGHITVKKKAMACVEQIGRGNFDAELENFPGKKAFINGIVETLRSNLRGMIHEMDRMSAEHNLGDIDVLIPIEKFEGSYRKMAQGINDMVLGHITVKKKAMACVEQIGRGNFDAELETFPGKKAFINQIVDTLRLNLRSMIQEMNHMSAEHTKGDIEVFIPAEKFEGSYRKMAQGINDMVIGHIAVKKLAMACVEQIGRGNFDAELQKFPGKKAFINEIVEKLRSNLRGMIEEMDHMSSEHDKGEIDVFIPADRFEGSYRKMAAGINDMVIGHIATKKKAMACVAEFVRGNFDVKLEKLPGKKVFINDMIESMRASLKQVSKRCRLPVESDQGRRPYGARRRQSAQRRISQNF